MDDIDRAQRRDTELREAAIEAVRRRAAMTGESALRCAECGAHIPEPRRRAVPGCRLCVDCQAYYEMIGETGG